MLEGKRVRIADLDCIQVTTNEQATIPVITLHGYGDSADGLAPLSAEWVHRLGESSNKYQFIFPSAPNSLAELGMPYGRAWWPLNMAALMDMFEANAFEELHNRTPPGIDNARARVAALVKEVLHRYQPDVAKPQYALGGFSQGSMLSMDVALQSDVPAPSILFQFSGTLICREQWTASLDRIKDTLVFHSHGRSDPVLPFSGAKNMQMMFSKGNIKTQWHPFDGPHTIPPAILDEAADVMRQVFGD
jgi:phospholipase/carboxylesterase